MFDDHWQVLNFKSFLFSRYQYLCLFAVHQEKFCQEYFQFHWSAFRTVLCPATGGSSWPFSKRNNILSSYPPIRTIWHEELQEKLLILEEDANELLDPNLSYVIYADLHASTKMTLWNELLPDFSHQPLVFRPSQWAFLDISITEYSCTFLTFKMVWWCHSLVEYFAKAGIMFSFKSFCYLFLYSSVTLMTSIM